jgi:hypothetical protein
MARAADRATDTTAPPPSPRALALPVCPPPARPHVAPRLTCDTTTFTVGQLIDEVVKKHLSFNRPTIDANTMHGDSDQLADGCDEDELDEDEIAKYARYRGLPLGSLPQPVVSGSILEVDDTTQNLQLKIDVVHKVLDPVEVPSGFLVSGAPPASAAEAEGEAAGEPSTPGSKRRRREDEDVAAGDGKRSRVEVDDVDDCVILE